MTRAEIKEVVEEAIDEKLKEFWINKEKHYQHHEFIDKWMKWCDDTGTTIRHSIIKTIVVTILGLIAMGFLIFQRGR